MKTVSITLNAMACVGFFCSVVTANEIEIGGMEAKQVQKKLAESGAKSAIEPATQTEPRKIVYQVNYVDCASIPGSFMSDRCVFQDQNNDNAIRNVLPADSRRLFKALEQAKVHVRSYSDGFGGGEIQASSIRCEIPIFLRIYRGATVCKVVQ